MSLAAVSLHRPAPSSSMLAASGIGMRKYGARTSKDGGIDNQVWIDVLLAEHPQKTAQGVEARTGISASTVDKWIRGFSTPSAEALKALFEAYGPEFGAAFAPGCPWLAKAAREARRERLDHLITSAQTERARLMEPR